MSLLTRFCLLDFVELLLAWQFSSQLELRSLVRRFGLLNVCLLQKMSRNPTNSFLSVLCRLRRLLFTDFNHVYLFVLTNWLQKYRVFSKNMHI